MLTISINTDEFRRDALRVHLLQTSALREAVRYTLNEMAVQTWKLSKRGLSTHFTLRNTWTARSLAFDKVPTNVNNIDMMRSHAGSRMEYLEEQEEGIRKTARGAHGVPIPTTYAAGQKGAKRRTKRVARRFYLSRLRVAQGVYKDVQQYARTRRQHLAVMIYKAHKLSKRVIYWESLRGRKGLYLIEGHGLHMIYNLAERHITSRARPWLSTPTNQVSLMFRKIYGKALRFQLHKLSK